jgi:signal transduction histidine kinase/CheY-like chemotaxis protein
VILLWQENRSSGLSGRIRTEALLTMLILLLVTLAIFLPMYGSRFLVPGLQFILIIPLGWAAVRFELRESYSMLLLFNIMAQIGTVLDLGPFNLAGHGYPIVSLELMGISFSVTILIIGVIVSERSEAEKKIRLINEQLEERIAERTKDLEEAKISAEIANRTKSEFLANMSHELRTPLNSILGFSQILSMESSGVLNEKQREHLRNIEESGNHLLAMVNDVLDLSKVEADKMVLEKSYFDIGEMLSRAPLAVQSKAAKKGISIETNIDPEIGLLYGDETRLKQVVFNLLSNAVKFTPEGKRVGIDAYGEGEYTVFSIWDEGEGVAQSEQERIFKPFEQIKDGKASKTGGTGLGLSINKRIVEKHQGTISIQSRSGEGSRFTVTLRGRRAAQEETKARDGENERNGSAGPAEGKEILVIEDNAANMSFVHHALDTRGYRVTGVESGEEGLKILNSRSFDLVLLDIQLPGMDGTETLHKIRERVTGHLPVIALTAYAMKDDRQKYLDSGFDGYLSKPIDVRELRQRVNDMLREEKFGCSDTP